jgi:hypothetical protein
VRQRVKRATFGNGWPARALYRTLRPQSYRGALVPAAPFSAVLAKLMPHAKEFASGAKAPSTHRAYRGAWRRFVAWCESVGLIALPAQAEALALYVTYLAEQGKKVGTIEKAVGAIAHAQSKPYQSRRL